MNSTADKKRAETADRTNLMNGITGYSSTMHRTFDLIKAKTHSQEVPHPTFL